MHVSFSVPSARSWSRSPWVAALLLSGLAGGCGGGSGGGGQSGVTGQEQPKPGGGFFFVDENGSGGRANLHLAEVQWGRLVDVHEIDAAGNRVEVPIFHDFVVEPTVLTDGANYILDRNLVTQRERLTIRARKTGVTDTTAFDQLLAAACDALPTVAPKDIGSAPPFGNVPRNACMALRFDDCLADDATSARNLPSNVHVATGYPPSTPFSARVVFDPNHGAVVGAAFHSTRVLVDLTTSEAEAAALPVVQGVNQIGLPESQSASPSASFAVRVPSRVDIGSAQSTVLTNLSGVRLDAQDNAPSDLGSPTQDVVRAVRGGNADDPSNGFLTDVDRPRVVGAWGITVSDAAIDLAGEPGFDFLVDFDFASTCLRAPAVGDVITVGSALLEVTAAAPLVGSSATDVKARSAAFIANRLTLNGSGLFEAPFDPTSPLAKGCWVTFLPEATTFPSTGVLTSAQVLVRFSEPMDPATLSPFRDFMVVDGVSVGTTSTANSHNIIVGEVAPNSALTVYTFSPKLPLRHAANVASPMHIELDEPRDLAGNRLRHALPFVDFTIEPLEAEQKNGAIVLRLDAVDEYAPNDAGPDTLADLRGQFFFNSTRGSIFPRAVATTGWPADRTIPVPKLMGFPLAGDQLPLNPMGAKVQTLWRYCDVGWAVRDETKYNMDVIGLNWSPFVGGVQADFFELFEIRLGHSRWLPDEPFANTGFPAGTPFEGNYLAGSNPKIVHSRSLGYAINPSQSFRSSTGTVMMPYPLNQVSGPQLTYTWRDTSILTLGADGGAGTTAAPGIPLAVELAAGLAVTPGSVATRTNVPSFGLPLLVEFKCFPSDSGLGINALDIGVAGTIGPAFRAFSAGGFNTLHNPAPVLPDSEITPKGGLNPFSTPPGLPTAPVDPLFYIGQLDTVVRLSRVHSVWLDSGQSVLPAWQSPVLEPANAGQPTGTDVLLDFRSATGFQGAGTAPFNGALLDAYGNQLTNQPQTLSGWSSDITLANNKRYLQMRITFVNNVSSGVSPELTALALPFTK